MSVRQWMVAGVLAFAGIGVAAAADLDAHDLTTSGHGNTENSTRDTVGSVGGDLLGINREASSSRHGDDDNGSGGSRSGGSTAGGSEHGGRISAPTTARPATLGWQSLLPGSIQ